MQNIPRRLQVQGSRQGSSGNALLNAEDFQWGTVEEGIQIGLWCSQQLVEVGKHAELRAAVRNVSEAPCEIGNEYGLATQKNDEEISEDFGGPRSTTPALLEPGEFKELFGWRLGEDLTSKSGVYKCWVIYRPKDRKEILSGIVKIKVGY
jgi:hypothetical protein